MRLLTIYIKNFGPFSNESIDLRGVSSATICGPNGAGKTIAFYEAIMWCLWKVCRYKDPDKFIRLGETDAAVIVTCAISDQVYRFSRSRSIRTKKGKSEFSIEVANGSDWVPTHKTTEDLLQIGHEVLTSSNFLGFGESAKFCKATASTRIKLLCEILGISRYADYATRARKIGDEARTTLSALLPQREELEVAITKRDAAVVSLREAEARLSQLDQSLADAQREAEAKVQAKAHAEAALAAMGEAEPSFHQAQVALLNMNIERLDARVVELSGVISQEAALLEEQKRLHAATDELTNLRTSRDHKAVAYRELEQKIEKLQAERHALFTQKAGLEAEKTKLEVERDGLRQRITEYEQVLAGDQGRAQTMASLQTLEQRMVALDHDIERETATYQSCDAGYKAIAEEEKSLREQLAHAQSQQQIAEELRAQWVSRYQEETAGMHAQIEQACGRANLLKTVPCSVDLQRQCGFTKDAAHTQDVLPDLKRKLAERITDSAALQSLAPFDAESHEVQARTLTVKLQDLNVEWFKQGLTQTASDIAGLRQTRAGIEREAAALRKRLPDAAYLAKATTEIPELQKTIALKESALASVLKDLETVQSDLRANSLDQKVEGRNRERDLLIKLDQSLKEVEQAISRLQPCREGLAKVSHAKEALPGVQQDLEGKRREVQKAQADLENALTHATRKEALSKEVEHATALLRACRDAIELTAGLQRNVQEEIIALKAVIHGTAEAPTKLASLAKRCTDQGSTIRQAAWLLEAYKRIPILMIENAIPVIEAEANRVLQATSSEGMSVQLITQKALKDDERIVDAMDIVVRDTVGERPYECYSGGEGGLIELAFRIALSKLSGARCLGPKIETLVIDEGFAAMDNEIVLPRLRAFLSDLAEEYPLMLIITHNKDFKDTLGSQITVSKQPGGSTVEIA